MDKRELKELLEAVAVGAASVDSAFGKISGTPFSDLGFAKVDHQRGLRQGVSEVIYGAGKTAEQIAAIAESMLNVGDRHILITRIECAKANKVRSLLAESLLPCEGDGSTRSLFTYHEEAGLVTIGALPQPDGIGTVVVATAGTSDIPVAEEAALTAEMLGNQVERLYDVGVAGLHRLLSHGEVLATATVIIAVAGMEGALPSVIAGLVSCPVIAVPTSVGYGASFGGVTALLAMLNSCASGVSVVNIDNGFGAAYQASQINHLPPRG